MPLKWTYLYNISPSKHFYTQRHFCLCLQFAQRLLCQLHSVVSWCTYHRCCSPFTWVYQFSVFLFQIALNSRVAICTHSHNTEIIIYVWKHDTHMVRSSLKIHSYSPLVIVCLRISFLPQKTPLLSFSSYPVYWNVTKSPLETIKCEKLQYEMIWKNLLICHWPQVMLIQYYCYKLIQYYC